jgi:large subunit ribosomal protein L10
VPNAEKTGAVAEIAERLSNSSAAVITEYRGLSVKQVTDLRRALGRETTYAVVKNTLTRRAAAEAGVAIDESLLVGPTAIAFVTGDPVEAARGLRDFARTNPLLVIKGGIMEGRSLSAAEVARIADLETRDVLLSKLAGAIKALPAKAAGLFQAPLTQMAMLAKALEEKKPAQAAEPVAAQAPAAAPEAEAAAPEAEAAAPEAEAATAEPEAAPAAGATAPAADADAGTDTTEQTTAEPAE